MEASGDIFVNAFPLSGKHVVVKTDNCSIETATARIKSILILDPTRVKRMLQKLYSNFLDFNEHDVVSRIRSGDPKAVTEFGIFCKNVLLGYCFRSVMHGTPLPMYSPAINKNKK